MKKTTLLLSALCITVSHAVAQTPFPAADSITVNNIHARIMVHGDMFWDPSLGTAYCHFPANAPTSINFASALWMSGYDAGNNLHIAAQTYRQSGNDYWPGPLNTSDTLPYSTSSQWATIWKIEASDIVTFLGLSIHTTTNTPQSILTWPGKGNTYAQGNAGSMLTISQDMAPFVDLNSNGIYEPLLGEYPDIKGDEALWWVFSDRGPSHNNTNGRSLGVEIRAMAYAYNRGTAIDDIVYFDYNITNKSGNDYHNFRLGQWDDADIGWYYDDFIGFDSSHRMGITYNGTNDDGAAGGYPVNSYGLNPPIVGLTIIVFPGDVGTTRAPAGSFTYFNNDNSVIGNPLIDTQYDNYLRGKLANGQHFTNDYAGPHIPSKGYGSGPNTNYVFTGDPHDSTQWSECICNNTPNDRRFVIASNDFTLAAGSTQHVALALLAADGAGGCPDAGFSSIKTLADTAWANYFNPPIQTVVKNISTPDAINIYPNPARDKLYIEINGNISGEEFITISNTIGQVMNVPIEANGTKDIIDVSHLPPGLYNVRYANGRVQKTVVFVKE